MLELSLPIARLDMRKALLAVVTSLTLFVGVAPTVHAQARGLPDFTDLVDRADPAVVNIRTTSKAVARGPSGVPGAPGGQDPYELFRWFFGPDFNPPGGGVVVVVVVVARARARRAARCPTVAKARKSRVAWAPASSSRPMATR